MYQVKDPAGFSRQVCNMFSAIAPRYDLLNRLLSLGLDRVWRKKAVDVLAPEADQCYLDIATGTGDVALEIAGRPISPPLHIVGMDFSPKMLELAKKKVRHQKLESTIQMEEGTAESMPFEESRFQGTITAFGVRNFADVEQGLKEMWRVLQPGGKTVILEFSHPQNPILKFLYCLYFDRILPLIGKMISRHPDAYSYLPQSVGRFPVREEFVGYLEGAGFQNISYSDLTLGIVTLYTGTKPNLSESQG